MVWRGFGTGMLAGLTAGLVALGLAGCSTPGGSKDGAAGQTSKAASQAQAAKTGVQGQDQGQAQAQAAAHDHDHAHDHDQAHGHDHNHGHAHGHEDSHAHGHGHGHGDPAKTLAQGGGVFFVAPRDGAMVRSPLVVKFGVKGKRVAPAGTQMGNVNYGHHHLIIDGQPIAAGQVVPMDDKHLHFGKGQVMTEVKLPEGKHQLTMQFADASHMSYGPAWSRTITVIVKN